MMCYGVVGGERQEWKWEPLRTEGTSFNRTSRRRYSRHVQLDVLQIVPRLVVVYITAVSVFTYVSYAEARNRYRLDVRPSVRQSLRLSVCLSHAGTVSKRLNVLS